MNRTAILTLSLLLAAGAAQADEPHVTTIPDGVEPAPPGEAPGGNGVACDVLIRYDDGTDDTPGSGYTLGGPVPPPQRLGIIAQAPPGGTWQIQSVGFFSEFWVIPGNVNVEVASVSMPGTVATETIYVDSAGIWETAINSPLCVGPDEEFSVMLCPDVGTWGVTGEDLSAPDGRSYYSSAACSPDNLLDNGNTDLMIWACVTPCYEPAVIQEIPTVDRRGLLVLGLLLAAMGAGWLYVRRRAA